MHEMNEGVVRWAAERTAEFIRRLDAHDAATRQRLDNKVATDWEERAEIRRDLCAQAIEWSRRLTKLVLESSVMAELAREGCCTREDSCPVHTEVMP